MVNYPNQKKRKAFKMKNLVKLFTTIALAAVIGFSMAACDDGSKNSDYFDISSGSGGTVTVTGIPSTYEGKYAMFDANDSKTAIVCYDMMAGDAIKISKGRVSLPAWCNMKNGQVNFGRYSGNDTLTLDNLLIFNSAKMGGDHIGSRLWGNIAFKNGSATISWSDGVPGP